MTTMSYIDSSFHVESGRSIEQRKRSLLRGTLSSKRISRQDVVIRNWSGNGLGAISKGHTLLIGEEVQIALPNQNSLKGHVRWVNDDHFGLKLDTPFDATEPPSMQVPASASPCSDWQVNPRHRVTSPDFSKHRRI